MGESCTDAEFEVISGPRRQGDPHPTLPEWRYAGLDDCGRPLWRKPPRFKRWQLFAMGCAAIPLLRLGVYLLAEAVHWPR